jgi:hypothetical protein
MKLTDKHVEVISRVVAEELEKQEKKREKQKRDYRLHNIKLLLKNYRSLVLHCQTLKQDLEVIDNTSIQDLEVELINLESIESLKKSKKNTLAMVAFIDIKIKAYKKSCNEEELKYFRVLEKTYLTTNKYTTKEIAEFENVEVTTVYKYLNKAIENLPVIFFGIGAIEFKQ